MAHLFGEPVLVGPKRQHYLPRFYLKGFCRDEWLWVFDREKKEFRRQKPADSALRKHLYTFTDSEDRRRYELEQLLSMVESDAAPALARVREGYEVSAEDREAVCVFLGFAAVRTPELMESLGHAHSELVRRISQTLFSDVERTAQFIRQHEPGLSEPEASERAARVLAFVKRGEYTVETHPQFTLAQAFSLAPRLTEVFRKRHWVIAEACKGAAFVTGDSPVCIGGRPRRGRAVGLASPEAVVSFPLSSSHCLLLVGSGQRTIRQVVPSVDVRQQNLLTVASCQRFAYGRDEPLLRMCVQRTDVDKRPWTPRFRVT